MSDDNDVEKALSALSALTSYNTVTEAKKVHVFKRLNDERIA
jgi:hypothetical protein